MTLRLSSQLRIEKHLRAHFVSSNVDVDMILYHPLPSSKRHNTRKRRMFGGPWELNTAGVILCFGLISRSQGSSSICYCIKSSSELRNLYLYFVLFVDRNRSRSTIQAKQGKLSIQVSNLLPLGGLHLLLLNRVDNKCIHGYLI